MSSDERSGWRDEWISRRHRTWGANCPMIDIDTVWVEIGNHQPRALVEYKLGTLGPSNDAQRQALVNLADRADVPAFGVRYWPDDGPMFKIWALNDRAREYQPTSPSTMTETEYVELLYRVRGREVPDTIRDRLRSPHYQQSNGGPSMANCRTCHAPIEWAKTEKGKSIPLDPGEVPNGNLVVIDSKGTVRYVKAGEGTRMSHFATCPHAIDHRRVGGGR